MHPDRQRNLEKLAGLVRAIRVAMLTTMTAGGRPPSRPPGTPKHQAPSLRHG